MTGRLPATWPWSLTPWRCCEMFSRRSVVLAGALASVLALLSLGLGWLSRTHQQRLNDTLLSSASARDSTRIKLLLARGADVRARSPRNGGSALHNAAHLGH